MSGGDAYSGGTYIPVTPDWLNATCEFPSDGGAPDLEQLEVLLSMVAGLAASSGFPAKVTAGAAKIAPQPIPIMQTDNLKKFYATIVEKRTSCNIPGLSQTGAALGIKRQTGY